MKIRDRLSLQFAGISAIILFLVLAGIYFAVERTRSNSFYTRLNDRALTVAELFLAEDNMSREKFMEVQKRYPQSLPHEEVHIYNEKGEPVFINQNTIQWPAPIVQRVRREHGVRIRQGQNQSIGLYYQDNSGDFVVLITAFDKYGHNWERQLLWAMVLSFFISGIVMFFLGRLFARSALSPISQAVNEVKVIRSSSLDRRLETKESKDEVNELIVTFNNLLEHLEQSFDAQRSFVSNASHELRTPLTSIMGNIEVTLAFDRNAEEYKQTLQQVLTAAEKLNDLINNLFDLAQAAIDVNEFEEIRLDELAWQVKDEWMNKVKGCDIELDFKLGADVSKYTIKGKSDLLFIAFGNIIHNAIKFSGNQRIFCTIESKAHETIIRIRDQGIGIVATERQDVFLPFRRGSNANQFIGFGIGLSLTEKILRLHGANIIVNPVVSSGTEFVISFPIIP